MRLQFILEQLWKGLARNIAMVVSVIIVTSMSLFFVGGAILFQNQIDLAKDYWYDRVQVSIFLCSEGSEATTCAAGPANEAVREQIASDLESPALQTYVKEVFYESKDEAYQRFLEQFEDTPAITENVTPEQMPESYRVELQDPEKYKVVSQFFTGREGVEEVVDQREILDTFFRFLNALTVGASILAGFMLVAAILLVATTIRLAAVSRRRETEIMRLVGASKTLLQLPFMLEGIITVAIGAALAVAGWWAVVEYGVQGVLVRDLPLIDYIETGAVWSMAPWLFVLGVLLASVSSLVTLSRYLKV